MLKLSNQEKKRELRGSELLSLLNSSFGRKSSKRKVSSVRRTALTSERSSLPRFLALPAAAMLLAALPAIAGQKHHAFAPSAIIENTGSTNTKGYTIQVYPNGGVEYHMGTNLAPEMPLDPVTEPLPKAQVKKFFADLAAAMPLTSLPVHHGMRSASFGTATYITYKGQKSPDLTFASDPRTVALKADIDAIMKTLSVGNAPRRPLPPIVIHADR